MMTDLRYPIGKFAAPDAITPQHLQNATDAIAALPSELRQAVRGFSDAQLDTPYRPDGWTVRQLIHHIADSHMNAFIRMRKALTENEPEISAYDEKAWAELPDSRHAEVELSLALIDSLHKRWAMMARSLDDSQWKRAFKHPERGLVRLDYNALLYGWHCKHHLAHIVNLRQRERW
jgi:hypothetical protein